MARTTVVDVRAAFSNYAYQLDHMGVDTSKLELSTTTGRYAATLAGDAAPGTPDVPFRWGFLGSTAREAVDTLNTITRALKFAHTHLSNP